MRFPEFKYWILRQEASTFEFISQFRTLIFFCRKDNETYCVHPLQKHHQILEQNSFVKGVGSIDICIFYAKLDVCMCLYIFYACI